jgi:lysophospholipid acyltransferase (LPLAT)-like uncharacterized protein
MLGKLKWIIYTNAFGAFIYYFLMFYLSTLRLKTRNFNNVISLLEGGETILLCGWHQQFFSAIRNFKGYAKYNPALMISRSRDGELIARVAHRVGWKTARGSSSKGGRTAMNAMIAHLKSNQLAAHILDGPQGPIGKVKPGAIKIAHESGALIVPFYVEADNAWYAKSWDQFMLPKPFSKVTLCYGTEIKFTPCDSSEEFERQIQQLEDTMKGWLILKYPVRKK